MSTIKEKMECLNEVDRFILLLAGANDQKAIPGPLWLQKEMYVLQNMYPELEDDTDFEPYFLGPHSDIVQNEAEELKNSNLITVEKGQIKLTNDGKKIFQLLKKQYDPKIEKISEFKEMLNDLPKNELLAFIYFSYPSPEELEKESIEYQYLRPKRKQLAISLFLKDKISAQKAAQIAGVNFQDFVENLKTVV